MDIPFYHHYYKLNNQVFTTIRGKSWYKKIIKSKVHTAKTLDGDVSVELKSAVIIRLGSIPLEQLKLDAEYPKRVITSIEDFLEIINKLRRIPPMPRATVDSEVTLITLQKI